MWTPALLSIGSLLEGFYELALLNSKNVVWARARECYPKPNCLSLPAPVTLSVYGFLKEACAIEQASHFDL